MRMAATRSPRYSARTIASPQARAATRTQRGDSGLDLIALRDAMNRNPQQLDENTILVNCLKRVGAVDPGFTPSMLASGVDLNAIINSPQFDKCNADPLHYGLSKYVQRCWRRNQAAPTPLPQLRSETTCPGIASGEANSAWAPSP